ncbi:MAG: hypothetical protein CMM50_10190 [Rhodospirillaceae bacterium]|nr:hypothetical protein [Rhodospirillaceae bacterium]
MQIPTASDLDILERTLWGEARGEGFEGMRAVAHVVRNRADDGRWPASLGAVCRQRAQFSCWNADDPNRRLLLKVGYEDAAFLLARVAAATALAEPDDPTEGANHYFARHLMEKGQTPFWFDPDRVTAMIGNHVFMRL